MADDVTDDELDEINRKRRAARLRELTREEARQQLQRRTRGDDDLDATTFLAAIPHAQDYYVPPILAPQPAYTYTPPADPPPSVPDGGSFSGGDSGGGGGGGGSD